MKISVVSFLSCVSVQLYASDAAIPLLSAALITVVARSQTFCTYRPSPPANFASAPVKELQV